MSLILALLAGIGLGYILERGDLCFHSTLRGLFRVPRELDLLRAYLLAMLIAVPIVQGLIGLGLIEPWVPPLNWLANIAGGVLFGIGMVFASSCITGLFYKLGHGMLGTLVGLAFWAVGDVATYRGPLSPFRNALQASPVIVSGQSATPANLLGPAGLLVVGAAWAAIAVWLWRSPRESREPYWTWPALGIAVGVIGSLAWLLARAGGSDYTFGTSGVPAGALAALTQGGNGGGSLWIPLALVGLVPGAFLAAVRAGTLWVRGESFQRYVGLAVGGLLMGVGAGIAGGCNLGHSLVGVPLLSLGSITTTASMVVGVWIAHRAGKLVVVTRPEADQVLFLME